MVKKIICSMMVICMVFGLFVSNIHAQNENEFLRFQNFIKDHPNGGTFIMEDDMWMGRNYLDQTDALYTNHQTYTIETNQHQIVMENMEITNRSEEDGWWSDEVFNMPSLIIEGNASKKPLVRIECNDWDSYQWTGVQIHAIDGPAMEIVNDDTSITGDERMLTKISATGNHVSAVLISDQVKNTNMLNMTISATGDHASAIAKENVSADFELDVNYSILKVNGKQATAFRNIQDSSFMDAQMMIVDVNGNCDYEKWQIDSNTSIKPITYTPDMMFEELPLPTSVDVDISRGNDQNWTSLYLSYDQQAYQEGVASGRPFYLYPMVDALSAYMLNIKDDDFIVFCEPGEVPEITGIPSLITDEKFAIKIPRPFGAEKIKIYASEDGVEWQYITDEIDAMSTGNSSPYISLVVNDVPIQMNYLKAVIVGGYYNGKETTVEIAFLKNEQGTQQPNQEVTPPKDPNDDGDQGGNHGQGGAREEGNYKPSSDDDKHDDILPSDQPVISPKPMETIQKPKEETKLEKAYLPVVKDTSDQDIPILWLFSLMCLGLCIIAMNRHHA